MGWTSPRDPTVNSVTFMSSVRSWATRDVPVAEPALEPVGQIACVLAPRATAQLGELGERARPVAVPPAPPRAPGGGRGGVRHRPLELRKSGRRPRVGHDLDVRAPHDAAVVAGH